MTKYSAEVEKLIALGSKAYALKHFESATETLGQACEKHSSESGTEDAHLLFLYGRALFQAGVQSSAVLGGQAAPEGGDTSEDPAPEPAKSSGAFQFEEPIEHEEDPEPEAKGKEAADEDDEDEAENEENGEDEQNAENEQTDFEVAWEVTDLARTLFEDELATSDISAERKTDVEKQLAEVYDILGEISLESENFHQAVIDLGRSVELKDKHNDFHSTVMSEAHYKYSLALEFCHEDPNNKNKAVEQMTLALDSVKKRIAMTGEKDDDLVNDLEIRLADLKAMAKGQVEFDQKKAQVMKDILGNSSDDVVQNILAAAGVGKDGKEVNDISGLAVRKKAPKRVAPATVDSGEGSSGEPKKVKTDESEKVESENSEAEKKE